MESCNYFLDAAAVLLHLLPTYAPRANRKWSPASRAAAFGSISRFSSYNKRKGNFNITFLSRLYVEAKVTVLVVVYRERGLLSRAKSQR